MAVHGNEYHDPDFEQQGVAATQIETHRTAATHTQPQPPAAHKTSHQDGGADEINVGGLNGELADLQKVKDHTHQSAGSGVGGKLDHGLALNGLADDDHPQYIKHSLATAVSDFLVASGAGVFVKKTLAEVKTLLNWAADIATHAGLTTGMHGAGSSHLALFGAASTLVSRVVWKDAADIVLNLSAQTTPIDWTDLDLTSYTSANAKLALLQVKFNGEFGTAGDNSFYMRKNGTSEDKLMINIPSSHPDYDSVFMTTMMGLDSGQVMEYKLAIATNALLYVQIVCMGYIE
jgi:hypothetical protein